jgi:hypothetical protein
VGFRWGSQVSKGAASSEFGAYLGTCQLTDPTNTLFHEVPSEYSSLMLLLDKTHFSGNEIPVFLYYNNARKLGSDEKRARDLLEVALARGTVR